jgi:transposase
MLEMTSNGAVGHEAGRAGGEQGFVAGGRAPAGVPDPELVERPKRRRFTAEYKLRILGEADACSRPGEIGALLRRTERLEAELAKARKVIEIQGNVSALLEQMLSTEGANEPGSSER